MLEGQQPHPNLLAGVVLEVSDLDASRRFYETIFRDAEGAWAEFRGSLRYTCGEQHVEFVRRRNPRGYAVVGQHQAYRVPPARLRPIASEIEGQGHPVNWWTEDHPAERKPTAYVDDPDGNRVQLVGAATGPFIPHVAIVAHDLEEAEAFYTHGLGGESVYAHGFRSEDEWDADDWGTKRRNIPCAPWTRRAIESYRTHTMGYHPTAQVFLRFGPTYVGLVLAGRHIQCPPEDTVRGAPRLVLHTSERADAVERFFEAADLMPVRLLVRRAVRMRRAGRRIFMRDFGGPNFVEVVCAS